MTAPLRRVLVRQPPTDVSAWRELGWRSEPNPAALAAEHDGLCALLEKAGAEVVVAAPEGLDAIYTFDPALALDGGVVLLRPGKERRRSETEAVAATGVVVLARLEEPCFAEGGDLIRLDGQTLLAGLGYRTNEDGVRALERLTGLDTIAFDLPHWHGAGEVMHLLSLLSPLDRDLVVAYPPLLPVRLAQLLEERGIALVEVPAEEFETLGTNVLALAPRRALVVEGNPVTRRRLEAAGVEVVAYRGAELSKGDGGPTCLTLPLERDSQ
jgi:dimethylargininase